MGKLGLFILLFAISGYASIIGLYSQQQIESHRAALNAITTYISAAQSAGRLPAPDDLAKEVKAKLEKDAQK